MHFRKRTAVIYIITILLFCLIGSKPDFTPIKELITLESLGMKLDSTTLSQAEEILKSKNYTLYFDNPYVIKESLKRTGKELLKSASPESSNQFNFMINRISNGQFGYIKISLREYIRFWFDNDLKLIYSDSYYLSNKGNAIVEHESKLKSFMLPPPPRHPVHNITIFATRPDGSFSTITLNDKLTIYSVFAPSIKIK